MEYIFRTLVVFAFGAFVLLNGGTAAIASTSDTVHSVVGAITSANGQARLSLSKGIFRARNGDNEFRFEVPDAMNSKLRFQFDNDTLLSASWSFDKDVFVQIRSGGKCVRLKVRRLDYGEGGFLSGDSEQTIVASGPCRESEPLSRLDDFLRLSNDTSSFFRGKVFKAFSDLEKCTDSSCSKTVTGLPIRRAVFYSSAGLPGLGVKLRPEARLILPGNGFLVLGANSGTTIRDLTYDVESDTGDAVLGEFKVTLNDGLIVGGDTILRIAPGSEMTASDFKIEKDGGRVRIDGGGLSGRLGQGTSVALSKNGDGKLSIINIQSATASFAGLRYDGEGTSASLSILRGQVGIRLESAQLWLTDLNSLRLGYSTVDLSLGCEQSANAADCVPVEWTADKINVKGTISNLATALIGGQFNLTEVGIVQLQSGQVVADRLNIDTSTPSSPITGTINRFEVSLQAQDLAFDELTSARMAVAEVKAYDIQYVKSQNLPVGTVNISGTIDSIEGGNMKDVTFTAGAQFEFVIERLQGDDPAIVDGKIIGDSTIVMSGGNVGAARLSITDLRYYRGKGDATLELVANNATYKFATPGSKMTKSEFPFKAEIDVKSIALQPALALPLKLGPVRLKSSGKNWKIDPVVGAVYKLNLPIAAQELVYAPIKDVALNSTLCAPKLTLNEQSPQITGKIDVFGESSGGAIRIYDNSLSAGIEVDVADRGCSKIAQLVCAAVGGAFGGPIGAAGLAVMCGQKIDEEKEKFSAKIRDESLKKVSEAEFRFGL